jgi:hypothetical protein
MPNQAAPDFPAPAMLLQNQRLYAAQWARLFTLTRLEAERHFCNAAGDVETLAAFDAERL